MNMNRQIGKWLGLVLIGAALFASGCARQPHGTGDHSATRGSGARSNSHKSTRQTESHEEHKHDAASQQSLVATLYLETSPVSTISGEVTEIRGMLHDTTGQMLNDFEVVHAKKIHLILVRDGLDEFAHLHPSLDVNGTFTVSHTFAKGGTHHVFVDHKPVGKSQATAKGTLTVGGESPDPEPLKPNVPGRAQDGDVLADVSMQLSGASSIVRFALLESSGIPITDLQSYLGARGHLVVIGARAEQYVHAHPLESKRASNVVEFEVHFPEAGVYKLWGQFQRNGEVHTIPAVAEFGREANKH